MKKQRIQSFNLEKQGLGRVLGNLEAEIMEVAWAGEGEVTIKEVWEQIHLTRSIAFNTVMTVMNRLVEKGYLQKKMGQKSHLFQPTQTKETFLRDISRQVTEELIHDFGEQVIVSFVEALEKASPEYLKALKGFLKKSKDEFDEDDTK